MATYNFTLLLSRAPTDDEIETLYESCGDATMGGSPTGGVAEFHREAFSLIEAITSAVIDVRKDADVRVVGITEQH